MPCTLCIVTLVFQGDVSHCMLASCRVASSPDSSPPGLSEGTGLLSRLLQFPIQASICFYIIFYGHDLQNLG